MRTIPIDRAETLQALSSNIYFDHLGVPELERLAQCTHLRKFGRGEALFFEGDACTGLYIVQAGCVKLHRVSPQGRQYIVRLVQEGETFNEVAVFDGGSNPVHAEALEMCQVWVVEPECLRKMVQSSTEFAGKVITNLGTNLRMLVQAASEMAFYQVTHRLARLISSLPEGSREGGSRGRWTQEQLAAHLGTVREVVARSLRELERSGAIEVENRRITIADAGVLAQWMQGPWS